ncbi:MAG: hypothetical protein R3F55_10440 [Alphaproteobacteria bacterium]
MPADKVVLDDDATAIRRALDYPYERHPRAYWLEAGVPRDHADPAAARHGRVPVLAYGSNAAPSQLARKFADRPCGGRLFVEPVTLEGWEVVYAARLTRYGAVPARLTADASCHAGVHLTWLTEAQAAWMDGTEGTHYRRATLPTGAVRDGEGRVVAGVVAYIEGGEPLSVDGRHAALAAVATAGRSLPAHRTADLLARAAGRAAHPGALPEFALRLVRDPGFAARIAALLRGGL